MNKGDVYIVEKSQNQCSSSSIQVEMDTVIERKNRRYFPDHGKKKKEKKQPWKDFFHGQTMEERMVVMIPSFGLCHQPMLIVLVF